MEAREGVTMRFRHDLLVLSAAALLLVAASPSLAAPKIGEPAPDFLFVGVADGSVGAADGAVGAASGASAGTRYQNSDYVGESARKKGVVVAWFPKAFTPG